MPEGEHSHSVVVLLLTQADGRRAIRKSCGHEKLAFPVFAMFGKVIPAVVAPGSAGCEGESRGYGA